MILRLRMDLVERRLDANREMVLAPVTHLNHDSWTDNPLPHGLELTVDFFESFDEVAFFIDGTARHVTRAD